MAKEKKVDRPTLHKRRCLPYDTVEGVSERIQFQLDEGYFDGPRVKLEFGLHCSKEEADRVQPVFEKAGDKVVGAQSIPMTASVGREGSSLSDVKIYLTIAKV